ncbi:phage tail protein [Pseudactinotalea sp. HY158]|uniref:phage tail protein n=1 Tax=Pseudactinotalea sp. HY158 TaxID=2654547 RepID=UPI00129CE54B|nr:phage tail protein [Pseudactinotalea sp. HY158]QGH68611.1 phage tail protein [Pseudactinotalea sp. HY158]
MLADTDTAVTIQFLVSIDNQQLGTFTGCEGLGAEVSLETHQEGGNNQFTWQFPSRISYPTIKLTRPLGADTSRIATWITGITRGYQRQTATIKAMTTNGTLVAQWGLEGVVPVRWSGPSFSPDSPQIATETLEIAHHGFIS